MKILGMGADQFNSRDGIIVQGCKAILSIDSFDRYLTIEDLVIQPIADFYPDEKFDLIVYCGTPWLWDQMQHTAKYYNTLVAIKAHPEAKVVWLGIGSSLYLGDENKGILESTEDQQMLRDTFAGHLVVVRDKLAANILKKANVEHHYLPCPSYYFNPTQPTSKSFNIAYYHAPQTGISREYWTNKRLAKYNELFKHFATIYQAYIVVCDPAEISYAEAVFQTDINLITQYNETFICCQRANIVLSSRVHNAVPALVYGASVGIVPIDSRARTLTDWFDIEVNNIDDLSKITTQDIDKFADKAVYRKLIKEFVARS